MSEPRPADWPKPRSEMTDEELRLYLVEASEEGRRRGYATAVIARDDLDTLLAMAAPPTEPVLDAERLYRALIEELAILWGEPSDAVSEQVRPIFARSVVERYVRLLPRVSRGAADAMNERLG